MLNQSLFFACIVCLHHPHTSILSTQRRVCVYKTGIPLRITMWGATRPCPCVVSHKYAFVSDRDALRATLHKESLFSRPCHADIQPLLDEP